MHPTVATTLRTQHAQLCIQLNDVDPGAPESTEVLEAYVKNLRRIHSLLLLDKLPHNYYKDICESLAQILLKKTFQHEDLSKISHFYVFLCLLTLLCYLSRFQLCTALRV